MKKLSIRFILFCLPVLFIVACGNKKKKNTQEDGRTVYKGLYSFGPEVKWFKDCESGQEFWAADSSAKLELSYWQMNSEKPNEPVYVEIVGDKIKSGKDGMGSEFDSTIVVRKLIKITKSIPTDMCN